MGQECGLITSTAEHAGRPLNCITELSKQVIYGSWPDCLRLVQSLATLYYLGLVCMHQLVASGNLTVSTARGQS